MRNRWNLILLGVISALTIFAILVVWPGWPKRYLPDFIDYPEGPIVTVVRPRGDEARPRPQRRHLRPPRSRHLQAPARHRRRRSNGRREGHHRRAASTRSASARPRSPAKGRTASASSFPGISPEEAADLIGKTALLEFRAPKLTEDGQRIVCATADGTEFSVAASPQGGQISETTNEAGEKEMRCTGDSGETGTVVWVPATATDSDGAAPRANRGLPQGERRRRSRPALQGCTPGLRRP